MCKVLFLFLRVLLTAVGYYTYYSKNCWLNKYRLIMLSLVIEPVLLSNRALQLRRRSIFYFY